MTAFGLIIIGIIYISITIWIFKWLYEEYNGVLTMGILSMLGSSIPCLAILFFLVALCSIDFGKQEDIHIRSTYGELVGLSNSSNINGHFILGSGHIDNVQYVFYNTKTTHGTFCTNKIPMDNFYYVIDKNNFIEYKYIRKTNRWWLSRILFTDKFFEAQKIMFHLKKESININNYYDISKY